MSSEQHHLPNRTAPPLHPTGQHHTSPSPQLDLTPNNTPPLPPRRHHTKPPKQRTTTKPGQQEQSKNDRQGGKPKSHQNRGSETRSEYPEHHPHRHQTEDRKRIRATNEPGMVIRSREARRTTNFHVYILPAGLDLRVRNLRRRI
ncbi:hypothetical protein QL285_052865 [Trifolium repens]|nr:hypothetical protein QL285_052865 [Trifolium repens]